jgi:hypothetical protein
LPTQPRIDIEAHYERALSLARRRLALLPFAKGSAEKVRGLGGWVFEQVLHGLLQKEMARRALKTEISQQVSIGGRSAVDLLIGRAAIEVKVSGSYEDVRTRYGRYRRQIEALGWVYLYVTLYEEYKPNVRLAKEIFGRNRVFILDRPVDWIRLVAVVASLQER